jgi:hypothetical protein
MTWCALCRQEEGSNPSWSRLHQWDIEAHTRRGARSRCRTIYLDLIWRNISTVLPKCKFCTILMVYTIQLIYGYSSACFWFKLQFGPRRSLLSHAKEPLVFEVQLLKVLWFCISAVIIIGQCKRCSKGITEFIANLNVLPLKTKSAN